ncbi:SRPBCC domain-containing protein [Neolewinella agarilytica]|uniref:Polyketide cyclase / dehydrase and lipid transport n=1 Tax=Neolewinella agarilytica TaxID=478744 RepID=A0A1H9GA95_9BACT|nr:SRPBCC domain-containing protein [Neolewinella agarilytica]SEQ46984.1 hypothetical protein SAMN05444359_110101 [Neolewinella agarilytica]
MLQLDTVIELPVSSHEVWAELTDFSKYPSWNPLITSVSGNWQVGNTVTITQNGVDSLSEVLVVKPGKELRWGGRICSGWLFDGEHYFLLTQNGDGTTTVVHGEKFTGVLVPLMEAKLMKAAKSGLMAMNEAFSKRFS